MSFAQFWQSVDSEQKSASAIIRADSRLDQHYSHAVAFESWRKHLLVSNLADGAPFWTEAQNDFLLSLVHGGRGVWRSALQALRSFLENSTAAIYFSEHPVEARRFDSGDFRLTWTETKGYLASYPGTRANTFRSRLVAALESEYKELSLAVHGSSESFRMTAGLQYPKISDASTAAIGAWQTRVGKSARAIHYLLLQHYSPQLNGARLPALREDVSKALRQTDRAIVKRDLGIVLPAP